jgi:hypothetical protein
MCVSKRLSRGLPNLNPGVDWKFKKPYLWLAAPADVLLLPLLLPLGAAWQQ